MISFIRGTVLTVQPHSVIVETSSGLGYEVHVSPATASSCRVGAPVTWFTYLKVTDQAHDLYGFINLEERDFFLLLMTVSGVGPKSALNILALGSMADTRSAIARGDVKYLTTVQGMGKKTAERVVVELKGKIGSLSALTDNSLPNGGALGEVVDGLTALGYSADEARQVVRQIDVANQSSEEMMREALRLLSR